MTTTIPHPCKKSQTNKRTSKQTLPTNLLHTIANTVQYYKMTTAVIDQTLKLAGEKGVAVFSKSYCPFCVKAKKAIKGAGFTPVVVELDKRQDGSAIQQALLEKTRQRTVPSVWLGGKFVGGCDDTLKLIKTGKFVV